MFYLRRPAVRAYIGRMRGDGSSLTERLPAILRKIGPDNVIFGEPHHPRRLPETVPVPEYVRRFRQRSSLVKMLVCESGTCAVTVNGLSFALEPGDLCVVNRHMVSYESFLKPGTAYSLAVLLVREWSQLSVHRSVYGPDGSFSITDQRLCRLDGDTYRSIDRLALGGIAEMPVPWSVKKDLVAGIFRFIGNAAFVPWHPVANARHRKVLYDVKSFLDGHFAEDLPLAALARRFSYSPSYLDSLFRQHNDMGIRQYIISRRVGAGAYLLESTNLTVGEISGRCGYKDNFYFSRIFKKVLGMPPRQYRDTLSFNSKYPLRY